MNSRFLKQSLFTASLVTVGTNVLGRFFGYAREATVAGYFGTSATFDTFLLAFTVPEFMTFVIFAALPSALIPLMRKNSSTSTAEPSRLFWESLISFALIFGLISALIYLFRGNILALLAPKLSAPQRVTGERLMTILSWFVFFRGVEVFFRSCLYDRKHFIVPATSPIIANLVILALIFGLYDKLNIEALAYGWLLASVVLFLCNGFFAFSLVKPAPFLSFRFSSVGPLLRVTATVAIIECIALIYPVIDRYLAAKYLGEGQIAALRYATFLAHIPTGMFAAAFAMASFPWISDFSVPEEIEKLKKLYRESVRLMVFVMSIVAAGMVVFSTEIVRVAFQRGSFDLASLHKTSSPFMFFALGIVFYSVYLYQMRFYYASTTLFRLGGILLWMLLIKTAMSVILVGPMEQNGLALATTFAWFAGCVIMTVDLSRTLKISVQSLFFPYVVKILFGIAVVACFWILMDRVWPGAEHESLFITFFRLALLGLAGMFIYLGLAAILRLPEPTKLMKSLRSRLHF